MKRANVLLGIGAVLLVVGLLAAASTRSSDDGEGDDLTPVLVARDDLAVGADGTELVVAGKVAVEQVPADEAPGDAITTTDGLRGRELLAAVDDGATLTVDDVGAPPLRSASIDIPEGKQAVAVTVDFTGGGAGYIGSGDRVNVYTVIAPDTPEAPVSPYTQLLLSDVEVLDVSTEVAPRRTASSAASEEATTSTTPARPTEGQLTLLLALDAADAERAIFANATNRLWFSVLPEDQGPSTTPGVSYDRNYLPEGP